MRARVMAVALTILMGAQGLACGAVSASERHAGYYYPDTVSHETYEARVGTLKDSNRVRRIGFVTGVTAGQLERPYAPVTAMFAKGENAQKLILVSLQEGRMDTIFRARAVLAMLTATARTTPVFRDLDPNADYTFLDLLKLLGFEEVTISDGRSFAHRITVR